MEYDRREIDSDSCMRELRSLLLHERLSFSTKQRVQSYVTYQWLEHSGKSIQYHLDSLPKPLSRLLLQHVLLPFWTAADLGPSYTLLGMLPHVRLIDLAPGDVLLERGVIMPHIYLLLTGHLFLHGTSHGSTLDAPNVLYEEMIAEQQVWCQSRVVAASCSTLAVLSRHILANIKRTAVSHSKLHQHEDTGLYSDNYLQQQLTRVGNPTKHVNFLDYIINEGNEKDENTQSNENKRTSKSSAWDPSRLEYISAKAALQQLLQLPEPTTASSFTLYPSNRYWLMWQGFILLVMLYLTVSIVDDMSHPLIATSGHWLFIAMFVDLMLVIDNILRATVVCYPIEGIGDLVSSRSLIWQRYVKESLTWDILGTCVLDWFLLYIYPSGIAMTYFRLLRLLHLHRAPTYLHAVKLLGPESWRGAPNVFLKLALLGIYWRLSEHVLAGMWTYVTVQLQDELTINPWAFDHNELYRRTRFMTLGSEVTLLSDYEIMSLLLTIATVLNRLLGLITACQWISSLILYESPLSWKRSTARVLDILSRHTTLPPDVLFLAAERHQNDLDIPPALHKMLPKSLLSNIGADLSSALLVSLNLFAVRNKLSSV